MNHALKRIASGLLALLLCLPAAASASGDSPASNDRADKLVSLHLFRGTGVNPDGSLIYNLDKTPTRLQGLIMLTRLLGLEGDALAYDAVSPFDDVSGEGAKYVAYAWRSGFTNGTTATTFEPGAPMTARGYVAFLLRALGYSEAEGDFAWGGQMDLAAHLGMIASGAGKKLEAASLNRGDMVDLSYAALTCRMKNSTQTLAEKLVSDGVFTAQEGYAAGVLGSGAGWVYNYVPFDVPTAAYASRSVAASGGTVSAHVITVNTLSPKVTVKAALVDNTLGHTASLSRIVDSSGGAAAVVNANFFLSGSSFQTPVGYVAVNGKFLYGDSGVTSLGIYKDGTVKIGRPVVYTRLKSDGNEWVVFETNTAGQKSNSAVLYNSAYGSKVTMENGGWALTATYGVITEFYYAQAGAVLNIPENGYVVVMGSGFASTEYFRIPQIGSIITAEQELQSTDSFTLDGLMSVVSGAPALVRNGVAVSDLEESFSEARFTTQSAPRTAVGIDYAGRLLLVSVPAATIQQLREVMLALGCADAFNLDGGASCGMYWQGQYLAVPGRELTVTLQVFVED
ncbi:MAG: phosphodiester glycosidase family protein [Oscillibacter sp.]|nr:phosphodiester glycosidase family protein [Oscillibacter sp.]